MRNFFPSLCKNRKAVSPLIASVLLLSITLTVIYLVSNWSSTFTSKETKIIQEKSDTDIQCSSAGIAIDNASYNCTSGKIMLEAYNSGSKDISDFRIQLLLTNGTSYSLTASPNATMYSGDTQTFSNASFNVTLSLIDRIIFKTALTCPRTARSELEGSKITGYGC